MNIENHASYLSQRQYILPGQDIKANNDKIHYWHQLLGKDVLEYLCKTNLSVNSFLQDTPFDIDNYSYKITPPQTEHSTIKTETNDTEQPFPVFYLSLIHILNRAGRGLIRQEFPFSWILFENAILFGGKCLVKRCWNDPPAQF